MTEVEQPAAETASEERSGGRNADQPIRVALVDDHPIMLSGLVRVFEREEGFEVVGTGMCAKDGIEIAQLRQPDLIFLDVVMPGEGMEAARVISTSCPSVRVVMLTAHSLDQYVVKAVECGASGYLVKGMSSIELVSMAREVLKGECFVSAGLPGGVTQSRLAKRLASSSG